MKGIRGLIGRECIENAFRAFDSIAKQFEDGIGHCNAEIDNHQKDISVKQQKIRNLGEHVEKAKRVLGKIQEFAA